MKKLTVLGLLVLCVSRAMGADAPIKIGDVPMELSISQISDRMIRVELAPLDDQGKALPDPASTVLVPFPSTEKLRTRDLPATQDIQAGPLRVTITQSPLAISVTKADGKPVHTFSFDDKDGSISFDTPAPVFGLGEGREQFDRRGHLFDMRNGQNAMLATNGATVPVPFLIGADGWAMFIHNPPVAASNPRQASRAWGQFDLQDKAHGKFIPQPGQLKATPLYLYIMALDKPTDAMEEYIRLTGHPAMPPKWALGYFQSHRSLAGPDEALSIAQTFRDKKLPCDSVIYLGTGYTNGPTGWNLGHGSLEFNPRTFPEPKKTIDALHDLHFKIILHKNAAPAGLFGSSITEDSDSPLHISKYWATHRPDEAMGIDGWWPDDGDELPIEARLARLRCYYEGPLQDHPDERPWFLSRNGYAGAARYGAWIWSGDVTSRWATLAAHVPVGLSFSASVSPFWGTDTGGFVPPRNGEYTGELYVRWFQFSAFNPLFRSHGRTWHLHLPFGWDTGNPGPIESPPGPDPSLLHNADVEPICKKFLELRYQLLPYNYTLIREACDTGTPPMRALWMEYPNDEQAVALGDEYLWGHEMLVAPVVEKAATTRHLYLPAGQWYDWWTNKKMPAPPTGWIDQPVDLATMPIFIRAGAILPVDPIRQYTAQVVDEPTTLRIYPGADGDFTLYDDDGHSMAYKTNTDSATQRIHFHWDNTANKLTITPDTRMKSWPAGTRVFNIQLAGNANSTKIEFKGQQVDITLQPPPQ